MQTLERNETMVYPALLRADRISRLGNKWLDRLTLDQATISQLSELQIGLFAEGFVGLDTMVGRLMPIASLSKKTTTVVVYSSREAGDSIYQDLVEQGHCMARRTPRVQWSIGSICFSSIENLARMRTLPGSIDSVILLDPPCIVHRARTMKTRFGNTHDRPQILVNFLIDQASYGVRPAFMLMTTRRAGALSTSLIARTFCMNAWWFLDGPTLNCG